MKINYAFSLLLIGVCNYVTIRPMEQDKTDTPLDLKYKTLFIQLAKSVGAPSTPESNLQNIIEQSEDLRDIYSILRSYIYLTKLSNVDEKELYLKLVNLTKNKFNELIKLLKIIIEEKLTAFIKDNEQLDKIPKNLEQLPQNLKNKYFNFQGRYRDILYTVSLWLNVVMDLALNTKFTSKYLSEGQRDLYEGTKGRLSIAMINYNIEDLNERIIDSVMKNLILKAPKIKDSALSFVKTFNLDRFIKKN